MGLEDRLDEYIKYVRDSGDPATPPQPLGDDEHDIVVQWTTDDSGTPHFEITIDDEPYRYS